MTNYALYNWDLSRTRRSTSPSSSPRGRSGFPVDKMDHAFVSETARKHARAPTSVGKRIVEFIPNGRGSTFDGATLCR